MKLASLLWFGPALLIYSLWWFVDTQQFLSSAVSIQAESTREVEKLTWDFNRVILSFELPDGEVQQKTLSVSGAYEKGERVELVYPEGDIEKARINNFTELYLENIYCFLCALICCFPYYINAFFRPVEDMGRVELNNDSEPTFAEELDSFDADIVSEQELFEFVDPASGKRESFHSRADVPPEYWEQMPNSEDLFQSEGVTYTYSTNGGEEISCQSLDELPLHIRKELERTFEK